MGHSRADCHPGHKYSQPLRQDASRIPVMGHADGICAVYVGELRKFRSFWEGETDDTHFTFSFKDDPL